MGMTNIRALLDNLNATSEKDRERMRAAALASTSAAGRKGATFQDEAKVVEISSGRRGTVLQTIFTGSPQVEVVQVSLEGYGPTFRGINELEADAPAAPAPR